MEITKKMRDIAIGGIEQGVDCDPDTVSADTMYEECYTLAFDALVDAGYDNFTAGSVASTEAQRFAQP